MKTKLLSIFILGWFLQAKAHANSSFYLLTPQEISIEAYQNKTVHDPYLEPLDRTLSQGAKFNLNLNVVEFNKHKIYWNNMLHFDQSELDKQIKHAGWWYFIGATLLPSSNYGGGVDVFLEHHSRHILEESRNQHFPVYDRYGLKFFFYKK